MPRRVPKKKPGRKTQPKTKSFWDLGRDGITQSLLTEWITCPERFRVHACLGLIEDTGFKHSMEFGSLLHEGLEQRMLKQEDRQSAVDAIIAYGEKLNTSHPTDTDDVRWWTRVAVGVYDRYCKVWNEQDAELETIQAEESFTVAHKLPSGRTIKLRGKIDGVVRDKSGQVWLMEHKTKSQIDEDALQQTLHRNLQAMFYIHAVSLMCDTGLMDTPIDGILYDVIRRPFSGDVRKKKDELLEQYMLRGLEKVEMEHEKYFMRWRIPVSQVERDEFVKMCLNPILERFMDWWEWVRKDVENPWRQGNQHHWMRPFGIYDSFDWGNRGNYYDLCTTGSTARLTRVDTLYPEL